MTELLLIRHGETDANRELRFQGHVDLPLNDMGHEQARRVGLRLASEPIDALFCSDLQRACQTAHPVREHRPNAQTLKPIQHADLREQSFGVVDGLRVADIQLQYPQDWAQWVCFDADYSFSGGETTRQFHARVMALLHTLAQSHAGQTLAVVTHGGVLDVLYRIATHQFDPSPRTWALGNTYINRLLWSSEGLHLVGWGDHAHLESAHSPAAPLPSAPHLG
jgi:probable phosphoglycerate mutase